jgi:D-alanyl-D-alanine carboxypeptidase (penicillin-binding protein 5/6)
VHLLSVVLGDADERARDADTLALLRYGLALYHQVEPIRGGHSYAHLAVVGRSDLRVALVARRSARFVLRRGAGLDVYLNGVPSEVRGPLPAGTPLGEIDARSRGRLVARVALVTAAPVPPPAAAAASRAVFGAAIALLGCSLPLMFVRRRGRGRGPLA